MHYQMTVNSLHVGQERSFASAICFVALCLKFQDNSVSARVYGNGIIVEMYKSVSRDGDKLKVEVFHDDNMTANRRVNQIVKVFTTLDIFNYVVSKTFADDSAIIAVEAKAAAALETELVVNEAQEAIVPLWEYSEGEYIRLARCEYWDKKIATWKERGL
jgi:hypothetical protein